MSYADPTSALYPVSSTQYSINQPGEIQHGINYVTDKRKKKETRQGWNQLSLDLLSSSYNLAVLF